MGCLKTIPEPQHLCLEEGTHAGRLYEVLAPHLQQIVVTGVRGRASRGPNDDQRDAFGLAESLRTGVIQTRVYKELGEFALLRELPKRSMKELFQPRAEADLRGCSHHGDPTRAGGGTIVPSRPAIAGWGYEAEPGQTDDRATASIEFLVPDDLPGVPEDRLCPPESRTKRWAQESPKEGWFQHERGALHGCDVDRGARDERITSHDGSARGGSNLSIQVARVRLCRVNPPECSAEADAGCKTKDIQWQGKSCLDILLHRRKL